HHPHHPSIYTLSLHDALPIYRYRPIASFTQRATLRLSTSRSIASSAFSLRSRASSARSPSSSAPLPSPRRRASAFTQLPSVPALIPRSRATCAIGLPVSRTSRTAPSRKSRSNFLRVSPIAISSKAMCPRYEGKPTQHLPPPGVCLANGAYAGEASHEQGASTDTVPLVPLSPALVT